MSDYAMSNILIAIAIFFLGSYIRRLEKTIDDQGKKNDERDKVFLKLSDDFHILAGEHKINHE